MGTSNVLWISIWALLIVDTCLSALAAKQESNSRAGSAGLSSSQYSNQDTSDEVQSQISSSASSKEQKYASNTSSKADINWYYNQRNMYDQSAETSSKLTFIAPTTPPILRGLVSAHNSQVCSTWGDSYFKTFDGDIFYYPGTCNYLYASNCKSNFEEFNIQIRRSIVKNLPTISRITMKIDGVSIELSSGGIAFNGQQVDLPYSFSGVQIDRIGIYIRVNAKLGLDFMWNEDDAILLELDTKYANQTCGLCGDFNGIPVYNEFISNNAQLTPIQYGNMQKLNGPTELCQDLTAQPKATCTDTRRLCEVILTNAAFSSCNRLVDPALYIDACVQDLCRCAQNATGFCLCSTFTEYSRQCAHAGGKPNNWRTAKLCPLQCNYNLQYNECGSSCPDTCTNPDRSSVCNNHCIDGCFCPAGTVFDDINNSGCIAKQQCSCTYNGNVYKSGTGYSIQCQSCTCLEGKWRCVEKDCQGSCAIEGGSHITSFDTTRYNFHGDCSYVLSKVCNNNIFSVVGELLKCGLTDTETCLKGITLSLDDGKDLIYIKPCGSIYVNSIFTQLPISSASVTIFKPSSFYIIVQTKIGIQLQVQLTPVMQVYIRLDPSYKNQVCGLCGNYNSIQADDFQVLSGVIEGSSSSFANTWKTQASCPSIITSFENPCSLSIENEKYATHWCSMLSDTDGPFAECHTKVNPVTYQSNCMFDSCNCAKSEECMCAALSSYVHACSKAGVYLKGWRKNVCQLFTTTCPNSLTYSYYVSSCQPTCRSLSERDITCDISFVPIDGCICQNGTFMDDNGRCVLQSACPCYYKGTAVPPGEVAHDNGAICTCTMGKLDCIGQKTPLTACAAPMVYFDCTNQTAGTKGSECQKSCQTLDMNCYSTQCVSGCMCPNGLIADGQGGCLIEDQCPCIHNNKPYESGATIQVTCNTCTCKNRNWDCNSELCMGSCAVYGDGHYLTFDKKSYVFNGDCEYTLAQDYCTGDPNNGTFRVITENIPCGTTGTTCSKSLKVFLGNYELILTEDKFEVVKQDTGIYIPYKVHQMGIYMVIEARNGLILVWDKRTSIYIKLDPSFQGKVCGLCGNYDGNFVNDYTTRNLAVVGDIMEFGNSWKQSPSCLDTVETVDACSSNLYRKAWSQKQCSVITGDTFSACHSLVNPLQYYDACVNDACACDTGGDCECFCTAVAAYAQACSEAGFCVSWRTPTLCPIFCDFYNGENKGRCEWHYKACGAHVLGSECMKTCRNPSGTCYHNLPGLEGCYPKCPTERSFFDEDRMECVATCPCYSINGTVYEVGQAMPRDDSDSICTTCKCSPIGTRVCTREDCCMYEGKMYKSSEMVYNTTDGIGGCITGYCIRGRVTGSNTLCSQTTAPTTVFSFSTTTPVTTTSTSTTVCSVSEKDAGCTWSEWYDVNYPSYEKDDGDFETFENIKKKGFAICDTPQNVECRAKYFPDDTLEDLGQQVTCSKYVGLICLNSQQTQNVCYNYQIRIQCCSAKTTCSEVTTVSQPSTTVTKSTSTQSATVPTSSSISTSILTTSITSSTTCPYTYLMKCYWTPWINDTSKTIKYFDEEHNNLGGEEEHNPSNSYSNKKYQDSENDSKQKNNKYPKGSSNEKGSKLSGVSSSEEERNHSGFSSGEESDSLELLKSTGYEICSIEEMASQIECEVYSDISQKQKNELSQCDPKTGLPCFIAKQSGIIKPECANYNIRVQCCSKVCGVPTTPVTSISVSSTSETSTTSTSTVSTSTSVYPPSTTSGTQITSSSSSTSTNAPTATFSPPSTTSGTPITSTSSSTSTNTPTTSLSPPSTTSETPITSTSSSTSTNTPTTTFSPPSTTSITPITFTLSTSSTNTPTTTLSPPSTTSGTPITSTSSTTSTKTQTTSLSPPSTTSITPITSTSSSTSTKTQTTSVSPPSTTSGTHITSTSSSTSTKTPTSSSTVSRTSTTHSTPVTTSTSHSTSSTTTSSTTSSTTCAYAYLMKCYWTPWIDDKSPTIKYFREVSNPSGGDSSEEESKHSNNYSNKKDQDSSRDDSKGQYNKSPTGYSNEKGSKLSKGSLSEEERNRSGFSSDEESDSLQLLKSSGYQICSAEEMASQIECDVESNVSQIKKNAVSQCDAQTGLACFIARQRGIIKEECAKYKIRVQCCSKVCGGPTTPVTSTSISSTSKTSNTSPTTSTKTTSSSYSLPSTTSGTPITFTSSTTSTKTQTTSLSPPSTTSITPITSTSSSTSTNTPTTSVSPPSTTSGTPITSTSSTSSTKTQTTSLSPPSTTSITPITSTSSSTSTKTPTTSVSPPSTTSGTHITSTSSSTSAKTPTTSSTVSRTSTTHSTPVTTSTSHSTSSTTTTSITSSTTCAYAYLMKCYWTPWIDDKSPTIKYFREVSNPSGGDSSEEESKHSNNYSNKKDQDSSRDDSKGQYNKSPTGYSNEKGSKLSKGSLSEEERNRSGFSSDEESDSLQLLKSSGYQICSAEEMASQIECDIESNVSQNKKNAVSQCDAKTGLACFIAKQRGIIKEECAKYKIRVQCCSKVCGGPTTPVTSTSISSTSKTSNTSPTTSTKTTSSSYSLPSTTSGTPITSTSSTTSTKTQTTSLSPPSTTSITPITSTSSSTSTNTPTTSVSPPSTTSGTPITSTSSTTSTKTQTTSLSPPSTTSITPITSTSSSTSTKTPTTSVSPPSTTSGTYITSTSSSTSAKTPTTSSTVSRTSTTHSTPVTTSTSHSTSSTTTTSITSSTTCAYAYLMKCYWTPWIDDKSPTIKYFREVSNPSGGDSSEEESKHSNNYSNKKDQDSSRDDSKGQYNKSPTGYSNEKGSKLSKGSLSEEERNRSGFSSDEESDSLQLLKSSGYQICSAEEMASQIECDIDSNVSQNKKNAVSQCDAKTGLACFIARQRGIIKEECAKYKIRVQCCSKVCGGPTTPVTSTSISSTSKTSNTSPTTSTKTTSSSYSLPSTTSGTPITSTSSTTSTKTQTTSLSPPSTTSITPITSTSSSTSTKTPTTSVSPPSTTSGTPITSTSFITSTKTQTTSLSPPSTTSITPITSTSSSTSTKTPTTSVSPPSTTSGTHITSTSSSTSAKTPTTSSTVSRTSTTHSTPVTTSTSHSTSSTTTTSITSSTTCAYAYLMKCYWTPWIDDKSPTIKYFREVSNPSGGDSSEEESKHLNNYSNKKDKDSSRDDSKGQYNKSPTGYSNEKGSKLSKGSLSEEERNRSGFSSDEESDSLQLLKSSGYQICSAEEMANQIECDVESNVSQNKKNAVSQCDAKTGLACFIARQRGIIKEECAEYKIRVQCCSKVCGGPTTPVTSTSISRISETSNTSPTTSTKTTSSSYSLPSTTSGTPITSTSSTTSTNTPTATLSPPSTTSGTPITSTSSTTSTKTQTTSLSPPSTTSGTPITSSSSTTLTKTPTTSSTISSTSTTHSTPVTTSTSHSTSSTTTTSITSSTTCAYAYLMKCYWTPWFDDKSPTIKYFGEVSNPSGGDSSEEESKHSNNYSNKKDQDSSRDDSKGQYNKSPTGYSNEKGSKLSKGSLSEEERNRSGFSSDEESDSLQLLKSSGYQICSAEEMANQIECDVESNVSQNKKNAVSQCDAKTGLACFIARQRGIIKEECAKYKIRVQCCSKVCGGPTTPVTSTSISRISETSNTSPTTSTKTTSSSYSLPSTTSGTPITSTSSTTSTNTPTATLSPPSTTSGTPITSTSSTTSTKTQTTSLSPPSTTSGTPITSSSSTTLTKTPTTSSTISSTSTTHSTPVTTSTSHSTSSTTTTSITSSTTCAYAYLMKCYWTPWFDDKSPTIKYFGEVSNPSGGDSSEEESKHSNNYSNKKDQDSSRDDSKGQYNKSPTGYSNEKGSKLSKGSLSEEERNRSGFSSDEESDSLQLLKSSGYQICSAEEMANQIECDVESNVSQNKKNAVSQCDAKTGLACFIARQRGIIKEECAEYKIRVQCCSKVCGGPTTPVTSTSISRISETSNTSPTTSTKTTSSSYSLPSTTSGTPITSTSSTTSTNTPTATLSPPSTTSGTPITSTSSTTSTKTQTTSLSPPSTTSGTPITSSSSTTLTKTPTTSSTISSTSTTHSTPVTTSTSHSTSSTTTTSITSSTTCAYAYLMKCYWTPWFDDKSPTIKYFGEVSNPSGGDSSEEESKHSNNYSNKKDQDSSRDDSKGQYNKSPTGYSNEKGSKLSKGSLSEEERNRSGFSSDEESDSLQLLKSSGYQICSAEEMANQIECDVESNVSQKQKNAVSQCDAKTGLACFIARQRGIINEECAKYKIRVQCCSKVCGGPTTPVTSTSVSRTSETSNTSPTTSTKTTSSSYSLPSTTSGTPITSTSSTTSTNTPTATLSPPSTTSGTPITSTSSTTSTKTQTTSLSPPSTTSGTPITSSSSTTLTKTPTTSSTISSTSTTHSTPVTTSTSHSTSSTTTTSTTSSTTCAYAYLMKCYWTPWFDDKSPKIKYFGEVSNPSGGDSSEEESKHSNNYSNKKDQDSSRDDSKEQYNKSPTGYSNEKGSKLSKGSLSEEERNHSGFSSDEESDSLQLLKSSGYQICSAEEMASQIECDVESNVSQKQKNAVSQCDATTGLACFIARQRGIIKEECAKYKIRVQCCSKVCGGPTTPVTSTSISSTSETSNTSPTTSTKTTSSSYSLPSTTSGTPITSTSSTTSTNTPTATLSPPSTTSGTPITSTSSTTSTKTQTTSLSPPSTTSGTPITSSSSTTLTKTPTTSSTISSTSTTHSTPVTTSTSHSTSSTTTTSITSSTTCAYAYLMKCYWTPWFDDKSPTIKYFGEVSNPSGGDSSEEESKHSNNYSNKKDQDSSRDDSKGQYNKSPTGYSNEKASKLSKGSLSEEERNRSGFSSDEESDSLQLLKSSGYQICSAEEMAGQIECDVESNVSQNKKNAVSQCDAKTGLACFIARQRGIIKEECAKYKIRVQCCSKVCGGPTTPVTSTSISRISETSNTSPTTSTKTTSSSYSLPSTTSGTPITSTSSTTSTNTPTATLSPPSTTSGTPITSTSSTTSTKTQTTSLSSPSTTSGTPITSSSSTTLTKTPTTSSTISSTSTTHSTPVTTSTSHSTSSTTTTSITSSTTCAYAYLMKCYWTPWIDDKSPTIKYFGEVSNPSGGDSSEEESKHSNNYSNKKDQDSSRDDSKGQYNKSPTGYSNEKASKLSKGSLSEEERNRSGFSSDEESDSLQLLKSSGYQICSAEEMASQIECDVESNVSQNKKNAVSQCDAKTGLACFIARQRGIIKEECAKYKIRVQCCSKVCGGPTTPVTSTSISRISETSNTSPTTSTKTTSSSYSLPSTTSGTPITSTSSTTSTNTPTATLSPPSTTSGTPITSTSSTTSTKTQTTSLSPPSTTSGTPITSSSSTTLTKTPTTSSTISSTSTTHSTPVTTSTSHSTSSTTTTSITSSTTCAYAYLMKCYWTPWFDDKSPTIKYFGEVSNPSGGDSSEEESKHSNNYSNKKDQDSSRDDSKGQYNKSPTGYSNEKASKLSKGSLSEEERNRSGFSSDEESDSLQLLKSSGYQICSAEEMASQIECDVESNVSQKQKNAVSQCDAKTGLACFIARQRGIIKEECAKYKIRVQCCSKVCGGPTTPVTSTSVSRTSETSNTSPTTSTKTTSSSYSLPSTTSGTPITSTSSTTSTKTQTTSLSPPSTTSITPITFTLSSTSTKTPTTSVSPPSTTSGTHITSTSSSTSTKTPTTSSTFSRTSTTHSSPVTISTSHSTSSTTSSTTCAYAYLMKCYWTPWINDKSPTMKYFGAVSNPSGGDSSEEESKHSNNYSNKKDQDSSRDDSKGQYNKSPTGYSNEKGSKLSKGSLSEEERNRSGFSSDEESDSLQLLKSSGYQICSAEEMASQIECDVESNVSQKQKNAVSQCDAKTGLACFIARQRGIIKEECAKYKIRVQCCSKVCGGPTTPVTSTSVSRTSETSNTSPTTSTKTTSSSYSLPSTTSGTPITSTSSTSSTKTQTTSLSPPSTTSITPITFTSSSTSTKTPTTSVSPPSTTSGTHITSTSSTSSTNTPTTSSSVSTTTQSTTLTSLTSSTTITITSTSGTTTSPVSTTLFTTLSTTSTTVTTPLSTTISSTTSTESSTTPSSSMITSPTPTSETSTSTHCFCQVNKSLFSPGDIIYRTADKNGCEYYAKCSSDCQPERYVGDCTSTTTESTPYTIESTTTSSTIGSTSTPFTTVPTTTSSITSSTSTSSITESSTTSSITSPTSTSSITESSTTSSITSPTSTSSITETSTTSSITSPTSTSSITESSTTSTITSPTSTSSITESSTTSSITSPTSTSSITESSTTSSITSSTSTSTITESATTSSTTESTPVSSTALSTTPSCGECVCQMPKCGSGYRVVSFLPPGACCVNITCVPDSVCVFGTDVYQRGSTIPQPSDTCQTCECSYEMDMNSGFYAVKCAPLVCDTTCSAGYDYKQMSGQCCGKCVTKQCTMQGDNNTDVSIEVGQKYRNAASSCSYYECNEENGQPILTKVKKVCQELDITRCDLSTLKYDEDGCCRTCQPLRNEDLTTATPGSDITPIPKIPEDCGIRQNVTVLKHDDCEVTVQLSYCGGPCMGTSFYSMTSKSIDHTCSCCSELEVGQKSVEMVCANGRREVYTYTDVLRCGCVGAFCTPNTGVKTNFKYSKESQESRLSN